MILKRVLGRVSLPMAVVMGSIILAGSLYLIQKEKQTSIEKQQTIDDERADLKLKQDECASLASGLKQRWNNVIGVTYDNGFWKECMVTFTNTKTGKVETSPLRLMQNSR